MENKYPFISFVIRHRRINVPIAIIYAILSAVVVFFVIPLEYTSSVSLLPSAASFSQRMLGNLGGLEKLAGINIGGGMTAQSQEMYMGIIHSKRLLDRVINQEYEFPHDGRTLKQNLVEFFEIIEEDERETVEKVLKKMREDVIIINIEADNDILYLEVTTENPYLSAQVANKAIEVLNDIVKTEIQKEYRLQLQYLENRLDEIEDSLKIAENELMIFLETNTDPTLPAFQVEQLRLQRQVQIHTELLIEFRKQLELFIANNMVNLADIKVLDHAYPSYRKSRPKRALLLITFIFLFGFVQLGINASLVILRHFRQEFNGKLLEEDQRKTG
jgi:uncharacterized protein involved in exopolysaccharide biosynthesis